jgi:hypothetical protein
MEDDKVTEFTADDLPWLNRLMRGFPAVGHGFRAVISVGRAVSFPVETPEELAEAVRAGDYGYDGETAIPVDQLPTMMPAYYFPINDERDFVRKVADAAGRYNQPTGPGMPSVVLREATARHPGFDPPTTSIEEAIAMAGLRSEAGGTGTGGVPNSGREG